MTPEEIQSLYQAASAAIPRETNQIVGQIAQQTQALAPGVAATGGAGGRGVGQYNYNRLIQPTVSTLRDQLVLQGRNQAFREGLRSSLAEAQERYEGAQQSMRQRQRTAQDRARRAAQAAASRASSGGGATVSSPTVGGVVTQSTGAAPTNNTAAGGARMTQLPGGEFRFTDANGNAINAQRYAQIMNIPFPQLVAGMANRGDQGARSVMSGPGVDGSRNPAVWRRLTG